MKVNLYQSEEVEETLSVDVYNLCSRKKFVSILQGLEGVSIRQGPRIMNLYQFCIFEFNGCEFSIYEDNWDYTFCFSSNAADPETIRELATYFKDYDLVLPKPRKTSIPMVALLSSLLIVTIVSTMLSYGVVGG